MNGRNEQGTLLVLRGGTPRGPGTRSVQQEELPEVNRPTGQTKRHQREGKLSSKKTLMRERPRETKSDCGTWIRKKGVAIYRLKGTPAWGAKKRGEPQIKIDFEPKGEEGDNGEDLVRRNGAAHLGSSVYCGKGTGGKKSKNLEA